MSKRLALMVTAESDAVRLKPFWSAQRPRAFRCAVLFALLVGWITQCTTGGLRNPPDLGPPRRVDYVIHPNSPSIDTQDVPWDLPTPRRDSTSGGLINPRRDSATFSSCRAPIAGSLDGGRVTEGGRGRGREFVCYGLRFRSPMNTKFRISRIKECAKHEPPATSRSCRLWARTSLCGDPRRFLWP